MNRFTKLALAFLFLVSSKTAYLQGMDILAGLKDPNDPSVELRVVMGDKKNVDITSLKKERENVEHQRKMFWQEARPVLDKIQADIAILEARSPLTTFDNKKVLTQKSARQAILNTKAGWKDIASLLDQQIEMLELYAKDPLFAGLKLEQRAFHSFHDLQQLNEQIATQEDSLTNLKTIQQPQSESDLSHKKKKLKTAEHEYRHILHQQLNFSSKKSVINLYNTLDAHKEAELLDLQVLLSKYEMELAHCRVFEQEVHLKGITYQEEIEEKRLDALRKKRDVMIRMSLRIEETDVQEARDLLASKKGAYLQRTDNYLDKIAEITTAQDFYKQEMSQLKQEKSALVDDLTLLLEWSSRPSTPDTYQALVELCFKKEQIIAIDRELDLLHASISFEKTDFLYQELIVAIITSWCKIKQQLFKASEELEAEVKHYETLVAELNREKAVLEDKRKAATARLNIENKALIDCKALQEKIIGERDQFEAVTSKEWVNQVLLLTEQGNDLIIKQIEYTSKLMETYSKILLSMSRSIRQSESMITELQRISLWQRSGGAISRQGIAHIIPDLYSFVSDMQALAASYIKTLSVDTFINKLALLSQNPWHSIIIFLKLFLILVIFFVLNTYLPLLSIALGRVGPEIRGTQFVSYCVAMVLQFMQKHLLSIFGWIALFFIFGRSPSIDIPTILFFLCSIPYLLYLSYRFVNYVVNFNKQHSHIFFQPAFEKRFAIFLRIFLSITVIIILFRKAFILGTYNKSELPDILFALYSISIRILFLTLFRKEDILYMLPSKTFLGSLFYRFINKYYYLFLILFIGVWVTIDPHIGGYSNLGWHVFWGLVGTAVVIRALNEIYVILRRSSSVVCFTSDGITLKERFQYARLLYGIFIIFFFLVCIVAGFLFVAWLWGRPVSLSLVSEFFTNERITVTLTDGQFQKISILDIFKLLLLIPAGFFVAVGVDRFVLHRMFSVLLVNPGVHNAVSTISYYVIVIFVITLGLIGQGFGFLVAYYIAPILLGMVWAIRDIFNDFVSYFVILIQRPLKIGDYIQIDENTSGVVRSITPRAVVLRRMQGYCIIVPNSRITRDTISNWDFNLVYIKCPDITIVIPYKFNAQEVIGLLAKAAIKVPQVLRSPLPIIRLENFGEYGFEFVVRVFITAEQTLQQWIIASEVRVAIAETLREHNVEIASPVRIVSFNHGEQIPTSNHKKIID